MRQHRQHHQPTEAEERRAMLDAAAFERTADAMRADLRAEGWVELPNTTPERWRSPDKKRVLPLTDAWSRARRDVEASPRPLDPPHETVVDRSADFVQPPGAALAAEVEAQIAASRAARAQRRARGGAAR